MTVRVFKQLWLPKTNLPSDLIAFLKFIHIAGLVATERLENRNLGVPNQKKEIEKKRTKRNLLGTRRLEFDSS